MARQGAIRQTATVVTVTTDSTAIRKHFIKAVQKDSVMVLLVEEK